MIVGTFVVFSLLLVVPNVDELVPVSIDFKLLEDFFELGLAVVVVEVELPLEVDGTGIVLCRFVGNRIISQIRRTSSVVFSF